MDILRTGPRGLVGAAALVLALHVEAAGSSGGAATAVPKGASTVELAILTTLEDGNFGLRFPSPASSLPSPSHIAHALPVGARPHGAAFARGGNEALYADFAAPQLHRGTLVVPIVVQSLALAGRSTGNGTLATSPAGRHVLSIGQSGSNGTSAGESIVLDFGTEPPSIAPIVPTLKVLGFVTDAIDFAPDGRAFVCHTTGVSVLRPPYTTVEFTMPFPEIHETPSVCALAPDGSRLFVTRMLSETVASVNAVRTTAAPYSAASTFVAMPTPGDVQGLGPLAVSPDGRALLVGQQFLFPPAFAGIRARVFLLRAPFDGSTTYQEIALPSTVSGVNCVDGVDARDCPGFEHIEVSADGTLAILTGNSSATLSPAADSVPAVFITNPFDDATRSVFAVQVTPGAAVPGRGTGAVRFRPMGIFRDGLE
jgi:hypothetical protein